MIFPLLSPKDPDGTAPIQWDLSDHVATAGTTLVSAELTEVDTSDDEVDPGTLTIGAPTITVTGYVTALVSGGTAGTEPRIRCRYELANGEIGDATLILPIRHR